MISSGSMRCDGRHRDETTMAMHVQVVQKKTSDQNHRALEICALQKSNISWEFQALYVCRKPCFGRTYKVSAWNSHHKHDFWHCIFSRDYFGELTPPWLWQSNTYKQRAKKVWGRDKMAAILQTTFSSVFSGMKIYEFRLRFYLNLLLRVQLTIFHYYFR